jgi:hypothetical protein
MDAEAGLRYVFTFLVFFCALVFIIILIIVVSYSMISPEATANANFSSAIFEHAVRGLVEKLEICVREL